MTRRVYQVLLIACLIGFTALFAKEIRAAINAYPHFDKVAHFGVFFILAFIMDRAIKLPVLVHIFLLGCYGTAIEFMQYFIPARDASILDLTADVAGGVAYFVMSYLFTRFWKKPQQVNE